MAKRSLCRLLAAYVVVLPLLTALAPLHAQAETLRCNGNIVAEGDSRISLLAKCGPPLLADTVCAPVFYGGTPYPVPEPWAGHVLPCQATEQWLYSRGPGNLSATVRFRSGVVQSIRYGQQPE